MQKKKKSGRGGGGATLFHTTACFFLSVMFIRVVCVKLMFIVYFGLMSLTVMVFSACVNVAVTLEHKTSHKGTFFMILRFMHHLKAE